MAVFFFDLDGTLIDSEAIWVEAMVEALHRRQVDVSPETIRLIETGRAWPDIFGEIKRRWPGAYDTIHDMQNVTTAYYQDVVAVRDIAIHPSVRLLKRLAGQGHHVGIVTGSVRERVLQTCLRYGMSECVKTIVSCEDYDVGKPHPGCYLLAAARAGAAPSDCCAFEDALTGVQAAKNAGMRCVALAHTSEDAEALASVADQVLNSLEDFRTD